MNSDENRKSASEETWRSLSPGTTDETRERDRERERDRLWSLVSVARALNTKPTLLAILEAVADAALQMLDAERAFVVLSEGGESPRFEVSRNFDREEVRDPERKVSRSVIDETIARGEPVLRSDAAEASEERPATESVQRLKLRSILCVPVRLRDRVEGALYVDNRFRAAAFGDVERRLLEALADHAAIAIETARFLEQARRARERAEEEATGLRGAVQSQRIELSRLTDAIASRAGDAALGHDYRAIIGRSPAMRKVLGLLDRVTESEVPVLVTGESGTGKELIARAIHCNGPRKEGPFVSENFAALPETLVESELFGHVKGAFTGADKERAGLFELAHRGTLFLDEVGDISANLQKKLLRVLQEGEVRRVGGDRAIPVDVRIVSATNRDLAALVRKGEFREDLFYRLNVIEVKLPPLRERMEDIPALVEHFIAVAAEQEERPAKGISRDAIRQLARRSWPGNVRELGNAVRRLVALSGEVISQRDVIELGGEPGPGVEGKGAFKTLDELEREHIERVLQACSFRPTEAARILGISYTTLWRKMKAYKFKAAKEG